MIFCEYKFIYFFSKEQHILIFFYDKRHKIKKTAWKGCIQVQVSTLAK